MKKIYSIKICSILILFGFSTGALNAQDSSSVEQILSHISINGSVDTYFRTNINGLNKFEFGPDGTSILAGPQSPQTSFANDPGFAFGMANIILGYEGEKIGFVADLVFGPRGEDAVFLSNGSSNIVNQLYVYYEVSEWLTLSLGNFNTFLGYEVISPAGNFHYSTSYMFSYGPFSHTGFKADLTVSDSWSLMLAVMNPTDYTEFNPFGLYTLGGQLGYSRESGNAYLNLIYGRQTPGADPTFQVDLTTGWNLSEFLYLGLNSTYNTTNDVGFYGVAIYPQVKTSTNFALGLRAEHFKELENDTNIGIVYGSNASTFDLTLTGNYTIGNLSIKPELRLDRTDEEIFVNSDLEFSKNLSSFILAAVYNF